MAMTMTDNTSKEALVVGLWVAMLFCPRCGTLLLLSYDDADDADRSADMEDDVRGAPLRCPQCRYAYAGDPGVAVTRRTECTKHKKQQDDVLGGADAWKNVDCTTAECPKCEHAKAYFMQIQIRSADEPSTIFYKCCQCGHQWREG
jgi:DNA-directed RNA polymerase III subunit RPC11